MPLARQRDAGAGQFCALFTLCARRNFAFTGFGKIRLNPKGSARMKKDLRPGLSWFAYNFVTALVPGVAAGELQKAQTNAEKVYYFCEISVKDGAFAVKGNPVSGNLNVSFKLKEIPKDEQAQILECFRKAPSIISGLRGRDLTAETETALNTLGVSLFPRGFSSFEWFKERGIRVLKPSSDGLAALFMLGFRISTAPLFAFTVRGFDLQGALTREGIYLDRDRTAGTKTLLELIKSDDKGEVVPVKPGSLAELAALSKLDVPEVSDLLFNLLDESAAGKDPKLKQDYVKVITKAGVLARHQLKASGQSVPEYDRGQGIFRLEDNGVIRLNPTFCWKNAAGQWERLSGLNNSYENLNPQHMFSSDLEDAVAATLDDELLGLFYIWKIASKLISAGAVMPLVSYLDEEHRTYQCSWIPAVVLPEIAELTENTGRCLMALWPYWDYPDGRRLQFDAQFLGESLLSLFLSAYVRGAAAESVAPRLSRPMYGVMFLNTACPEAEAFAVKNDLRDFIGSLVVSGRSFKPVVVLSDPKMGQAGGAGFNDAGSETETPENAEPEKTEPAVRPQPDAEFGTQTELQFADSASSAEAGTGNTLPQPVAPTAGAVTETGQTDLFYPDPAESSAGAQTNAHAGTYGPTEIEVEATVLPDEDAEFTFEEVPPEVGFSVKLGVNSEAQKGDSELGYKTVSAIINEPDFKPLAMDLMRLAERLRLISEVFAPLSSDLASECFIPLTRAPQFLEQVLPVLKRYGVGVIMSRSLRTLLMPKSVMRVKLNGSFQDGSGFLGLAQLLDFDWELAVGNHRISVEEYKTLSEHLGQVVRFGRHYVYVDPNEFDEFSRKVSGQGKQSRAQLLAAALQAAGSDGSDEVIADQGIKDVMHTLTKETEAPLPSEFNAVLRPYQERGYRWLYRNVKSGIGSIIADDMGLGKTIQVIAMLEKLREDGELDDKQALVVVPTSVLINWQREIEKFAPKLSNTLFYGTHLKVDPEKDVVLTTYGKLRNSLDELNDQNLKWRVMVIDEAQNIKNHSSKVSQAVRSVNADACIAMSGTPVENRLLDYWSVMDFVNPGLMGSAASFKADFSNPIEKKRDPKVIDRFKTLSSPFILRRLKTDKSIISDLPDKVTEDVMCSLTPQQAALYTGELEDKLNTINSADDNFSRKRMILALLTHLKQICDSPELILKDSRYEAPEFTGKAQTLLMLLSNLKEAGRKTLIFTQFKTMGDLLCRWVNDALGRRPQFIHGGVELSERMKIVDAFQSDPKEQVLVLSLKAAGTGLNLTAASAVIHYDLWWNPAVEAQATDRAYRIGQHQNVQIFRFICAGTFEEKVNAMLQSKRELADLTVTAGENWLGDLSYNELSDLIALNEESVRNAEAAAGQDRKQ